MQSQEMNSVSVTGVQQTTEKAHPLLPRQASPPPLVPISWVNPILQPQPILKTATARKKQHKGQAAAEKARPPSDPSRIHTVSSSILVSKTKATKNTDTRFKCPHCDHIAKAAANLKVHLRERHSDEKPYGCPTCALRFKRAWNLKTHMQTHDPSTISKDPLACGHCDYRTHKKGNLRVHLRTHSGDKPFKCDVCDYASSRPSHLKVHLRTHTGERPYPCTVCDYRAKDSSGLTMHMQTHRGSHSWKIPCERCSAHTFSVTEMSRHILKSHASDPDVVIKTQDTCVVCEASDPTFTCAPCGHQCLCSRPECLEETRATMKCPLCDEPAELAHARTMNVRLRKQFGGFFHSSSQDS
eukprot:m.434376 g.434376  ORF g.434376 m.434376 type:complete len:355 (-) comp17705_c0_seq1:1216-2280(-)